MNELSLQILLYSFLYFASQSSYYLNVLDFGAKGDNRTDDTDAIQKTLDSQQSGGTVIFPCGTYRVALNVLQVRVKGLILQGASRNCATIVPRASGPGVLLNMTSAMAGDLKVRDLMISGNNQRGVICLVFGTSNNPKTSHVTLTDVKVTQCDPAIKLNNVWDFALDNSLVEFNRGDGIDMVAPMAITGVYVRDSRIGNNGGFGVKNFGPGTVTQFAINQSEVSYNGNTEIVFGPSRDWVVRDTWFEEFASPQLAMDVGGCWRCTIDSNHIDHAIHGIFSALKINGLTVSNNSFTNTRGAAVRLDGGIGEAVIINGNRSNTVVLAPTTGTAKEEDNQLFSSH